MTLRSSRWFADDTEVGLEHRAALRALGHDRATRSPGPVVAIMLAGGNINPCDIPGQRLVPEVERGVEAAGGTPLTIGTIPLSEDLMKPTAMLYRNLLAIEVEEVLRSYPLDGVVLIGGCDKSLPGLLMGSASAGLPTIALATGYRQPGCVGGVQLAAGTDLWRYWERRRAGALDDQTWNDLEVQLGAGQGVCNVMGTASTMAVLTESLGLMLPGASVLPAGDDRALDLARRTGQRAVELVRESVGIGRVLTATAFQDALTVLCAVGGSTNAVIHLTAIAGRLGITVTLQQLREVGQRTPLLCDLAPCGRYTMQDLDATGGLAAVLGQLDGLLERDRVTVAKPGDPAMSRGPGASALGPVRLRSSPVSDAASLSAVWGSLAPDGAVIKVAAASHDLLRHTGPALVFHGYGDMVRRIDDDDLPVVADSVLVLAGIGPRATPGMPEWGEIPIPRTLLRRGVTDMVRISDGRMSGTSFGTIVLHVAPEAAAGGPIGLVQDGDLISLDVPAGRLDLLVDESELRSRREEQEPLHDTAHLRGWPLLYQQHVLQAPQGCDLDFLVPSGPAAAAWVEPTIGRS